MNTHVLAERPTGFERWAPGRRGSELDLGECRVLGEQLGDLHGALAGLAPTGPASGSPVPTAAEVRAVLDGYVRLIASLSRPDDFDMRALAHLRWRCRTLDELAHLRPDDTVAAAGWAEAESWADAELSMVLDWDRVGRRPVAAELIRAAVLLFGDGAGLDLPRVGAFVAGYRSMRPIADDRLADALHRLWWHWLCGQWSLSSRYHHADTSADQHFLAGAARLQWWTPRREQVLAGFTSG